MTTTNAPTDTRATKPADRGAERATERERADERPVPGGTGRTSAVDKRGGSTEMVSGQGRTSIADSVVRKIAGVATREISGVHNLGTGGARAMGSFRQRIPGSSGPNVSQGVSVEVGERQAAIDLDVVAEYGVSIVDLSQAIRRNVISSVEGMTGLEVTEVNISVDDIFIAEEEDDRSTRVQ